MSFVQGLLQPYRKQSPLMFSIVLRFHFPFPEYLECGPAEQRRKKSLRGIHDFGYLWIQSTKTRRLIGIPATCRCSKDILKEYSFHPGNPDRYLQFSVSSLFSLYFQEKDRTRRFAYKVGRIFFWKAEKAYVHLLCHFRQELFCNVRELLPSSQCNPVNPAFHDNFH